MASSFSVERLIQTLISFFEFLLFMEKSQPQKLFEEAKRFVELHSKKGANDIEIRKILEGRPFIAGEFVIDFAMHVGTKPYDMSDIGVKTREIEDGVKSDIDMFSKEWKQYIERNRKKGELIPATYSCTWYLGTTNGLSRKLSFYDPRINQFTEKYNLKPVFVEDEGKISNICLVNEEKDLDVGSLYPNGYLVGTALALHHETEDEELYEKIGKGIYCLQEKVNPLRAKMQSLKRRNRRYLERIDREMEGVNFPNNIFGW